MDLSAMLAPLWRGKWIIVALSVLLAGLATYWVTSQDQRYTATAHVMFEPQRLRIIELNSVVVPDNSPELIRNEMEVLRSAVLLEQVIDRLRLDQTSEFNRQLRGEAGGPNRIQSAFGRVNWPPVVAASLRRAGLLHRAPRAETPAEQQAERLRIDIVDALRRNLDLQIIRDTRVVQISYESTNPFLATAIANAVGEQYITFQLERRRDDIAQATQLLGTRVRDLDNRLARADEAVQLAELELAIGAEHGSPMLSGQIETLQTSLTEVSTVRQSLEERYGRASEALRSGSDIFVIPEFAESSLISSYRAREIELLDQEVSMRSVVANLNNPTLVRIQARLGEVRSNIETEANRILASMAAQIESARVTEERLSADLAALQQRGMEQARSEMRVARLQQEAEAVRAMHSQFMNRMNEITEQAALQAPEARFLTRATFPDEPNTRYAMIVVTSAAMLGAGLAVGLILLLERLNDTFRTAAALEQRTGLKLLAGIPRAGRRAQPRDLLSSIVQKPHSPLAESARNLRTSILFSNIDQAPKVVMITSSLPGEGKSATALLTAVTSVQMERSAIIVDCDLRRGTLGRVFPRDAEQPGLFAALQGTSSIEEAVYVEPETGLHVLAPERVGSGVGNPADILASRRFQRLIGQLRARYDLVIIDTPPVLAVTDARIVAQHVDAVVYLARWNGTRQGAVIEGLMDLHSVNAKIAGIAMTMVDERKAKKYLEAGYLYKHAYA